MKTFSEMNVSSVNLGDVCVTTTKIIAATHV